MDIVMIPLGDDRHYLLSQQDRRSLMWNQTASRRQHVPSYSNSLVQGDVRMRKCSTCGKVFTSPEGLRRHSAVNHTGTKPVVCHVCGKRFGSTRQMTSHYRIHTEPRLEEFGILTKRKQRDLVSSSSSSSQTTVGSFHRIPKNLKSYISDPSVLNQSFGTNQTFNESAARNSLQLKRLREQYADPETPKQNVTGGSLPEVTQSSPRQKLPSIDPGHISVIGSAIGMSKTIETSEKSNFTKEAEEELIKSRMEEIVLAGRSPTPKSFRTLSGILPAERKPNYVKDNEIWDTESHVTRRMSGYTAVSGYDPYSRETVYTRGRQRSAMTFPKIR